MALKKEEIQYIIDTLTFYNKNTELKNDSATNLVGKSFGTSRSLELLNRAMEECSKGRAALSIQNVNGSAWELPTGVYQVGVDRAAPNDKDHSCRVWMKKGISGEMVIVAEEHYR